MTCFQVALSLFVVSHRASLFCAARIVRDNGDVRSDRENPYKPTAWAAPWKPQPFWERPEDEHWSKVRGRSEVYDCSRKGNVDIVIKVVASPPFRGSLRPRIAASPPCCDRGFFFVRKRNGSTGKIRTMKYVFMWIAWVYLATGCLPDTDISQLTLDAETKRLVLLVHGAGPDENPSVWADHMADEIADAFAENDDTGVAVHAWDWSARSENRQLAPSAANDEGRAVANVVTGSELGHLHVVAHSTGALVATAMLDELTAMEVAPTTHLTLLDPFSLFGVVDCSKATVCEVWRNSDDGAPGSDDFVPTAFNVDVTSTRPTGFDERSHWWPIEAWRRTIETRAQPALEGAWRLGCPSMNCGSCCLQGAGTEVGAPSSVG